jgi:hypothetical protein
MRLRGCPLYGLLKALEEWSLKHPTCVIAKHDRFIFGEIVRTDWPTEKLCQANHTTSNLFQHIILLEFNPPGFSTPGGCILLLVFSHSGLSH